MDMIYIILPIYNRYNITQRFIHCLKTQTYQNYHLILIDDGSTDGTEVMVRNQIESVTVIRGKGDWWWAGSLQQGINWLKKSSVGLQDIVLFINDDTVFDNNFLEKAIQLINSMPNTIVQAYGYDINTSQLIEPGVSANLHNISFRHTTNPEEVNCLATRSLFLKWEDLLRIGNFYPQILPHYLSDYEYTIRAKNKGLNLYASPEIKVHYSTETSGYHQYQNFNFVWFCQTLFSNKSPINPWHWTIFTILVSPKPLLIVNLIRVWKRSLGTLGKQLIYSFNK